MSDGAAAVQPDQHVVEGAFTLGGDARLIASKCDTCETYAFPRSFACPNPSCEGRDVRDAELSRSGRLASFTVVHYPPPAPYVAADPFEPFAIAEVAFPEGIQVVGPVTGCDPADLKMGMEMETVVEPYYTGRDGSRMVGWKFRPAGGHS
jgi:hypothetical protein